MRENKSVDPALLRTQTRGIQKSSGVIRVLIISPVGSALVAAQAKAAIKHPTRPSVFLPFAMSADGNAPATHYACYQKMTPSLKAEYIALLGAGGTKVIELTDGQTYKTVLASEGLQRVK